ncbi:MAG: phosphatase PAP2 family protein [Burkholderiaceae bacterium]
MPRLPEASRPHADDVLLLRCSLPALLIAWVLSQPLDMPLAQLLFEWQGGQWSLTRHVLLEDVLHRGGHAATLLAWIALFGATALHWRRDASRAWTRPAARLLLAVLAAALLVAWLKSVTRMDCPWGLAAFGGPHPFVPLFAPRPLELGRPACFPAAHAASGYAWAALYFFFATVRPSWRWAGLAAGVLAGLVFGIAQQLRGAHFLSHDVASVTLCWTVACVVDGIARRRGRLASAGEAA